MTKLYPPCRDQFGKKIRGAIVYRTRRFGSKVYTNIQRTYTRLVWNGRVRPAAYFLPPRY